MAESSFGLPGPWRSVDESRLRPGWKVWKRDSKVATAGEGGTNVSDGRIGGVVDVGVGEEVRGIGLFEGAEERLVEGADVGYIFSRSIAARTVAETLTTGKAPAIMTICSLSSRCSVT